MAEQLANQPPKDLPHSDSPDTAVRLGQGMQGPPGQVRSQSGRSLPTSKKVAQASQVSGYLVGVCSVEGLTQVVRPKARRSRGRSTPETFNGRSNVLHTKLRHSAGSRSSERSKVGQRALRVLVLQGSEGSSILGKRRLLHQRIACARELPFGREASAAGSASLLTEARWSAAPGLGDTLLPQLAALAVQPPHTAPLSGLAQLCPVAGAATQRCSKHGFGEHQKFLPSLRGVAGNHSSSSASKAVRPHGARGFRNMPDGGHICCKDVCFGNRGYGFG